MRVAISGASGLIGRALIAELRGQSAELALLSRRPERLQAMLQPGDRLAPSIARHPWQPAEQPAPVAALRECRAVVHLAGEPIAQRWSASARRRIRESRILSTRNLVAGLRALADAGQQLPEVLLSGSATGYYGAHGAEPLDEQAPVGAGFLAELCAEWEQEARVAAALGIRVVLLRTGVVLDRSGGALAKMLPPFRMGLAGPIAGGRQFVSWIAAEDVAGIIAAAIADPKYSGPVNLTAPHPVTNAELTRTLAGLLHRPAVTPLPAFALRALYGEMAELLSSGARVLPARALIAGYQFRQPLLRDALLAALR